MTSREMRGSQMQRKRHGELWWMANVNIGFIRARHLLYLFVCINAYMLTSLLGSEQTALSVCLRESSKQEERIYLSLFHLRWGGSLLETPSLHLYPLPTPIPKVYFIDLHLNSSVPAQYAYFPIPSPSMERGHHWLVNSSLHSSASNILHSVVTGVFTTSTSLLGWK